MKVDPKKLLDAWEKRLPLPCPWCGKKKYSIGNWGTGKNDRDKPSDWFKYSVYCSNGKCSAVGPYGKNELAAVIRWNLAPRFKTVKQMAYEAKRIKP